MTPEQPEALQVALEVIRLLDLLEIRYHLGGSYASSVHGTPRQTQDIDLVIEADEESVSEFASQLPESYYRDVETAREAARKRASFNLVHLPSGVKIDLFVRGDRPFDIQEFERCQDTRLDSAPGRTLRVKSAEDTILPKLEWFRQGGEVSDRQWNDVRGVLANRSESLDFAYLERWARDLGVGDLLERARGGG